MPSLEFCVRETLRGGAKMTFEEIVSFISKTFDESCYTMRTLDDDVENVLGDILDTGALKVDANARGEYLFSLKGGDQSMYMQRLRYRKSSKPQTTDLISATMYHFS
jgi:hypothetical protein